MGAHVDNAIRAYLDTPLQVRTDVSATLFISAPEDYDGVVSLTATYHNLLRQWAEV